MTPEQIITDYRKAQGWVKGGDRHCSPPLVFRPFSGLYKIILDFWKSYDPAMTSLFSIVFWICNFCHFLHRKSFFDSGVKIAYYPIFLTVNCPEISLWEIPVSYHTALPCLIARPPQRCLGGQKNYYNSYSGIGVIRYHSGKWGGVQALKIPYHAVPRRCRKLDKTRNYEPTPELQQAKKI